MTTNIPPHNLREVIDACICVLDNPNATLDDLMEHIKGPDFPTGGIIMGRSGIRAAYATGRGKITLRGRAEIVEKKNGRYEIVITEIPYMVNKTRLLESIGDLVKDKRIEGISDLNDLSSSRTGMKILVEIKKDANPQVVLNQLYRYTQLQDTVGVILLALVYAVQFTVGIPMWNDVMNKSTIANIHTLSSVCAMLLFLPCSGVLSKLALLTVPDSAEEAQELSMPVLDERLFKSPAVALQQAKSAVVKMSRRAARNVNLAAPLLLKMDEDTVSAIRVRENLIDRMEVAISNYLIKMTDQELGDDESHTVTELLNFVTEFERIGDYAVNIMEKAEELQEKEASFSENATKELQLLENALNRILNLTNDAFENSDMRLAAQVEPLEEVIDVMAERLRDQHILRLKDGVCSIDTGVVFLDVLNNAERISDHCSNVAARLIGMDAGEDYDSHTLKSIMHHNPTKDYMLEYEECRKAYLVPLEEMEA